MSRPKKNVKPRAHLPCATASAARKKCCSMWQLPFTKEEKLTAAEGNHLPGCRQMHANRKEATTHLIFIDSAGMKSHVAAEKNAIDSQNTRQAPSRRGFFECIQILFCARGWRRIRKWERIGRSKNLHRPKLGREEVMRTHQSLSADGFFQRTRILGVWTVFFFGRCIRVHGRRGGSEGARSLDVPDGCGT